MSAARIGVVVLALWPAVAMGQAHGGGSPHAVHDEAVTTFIMADQLEWLVAGAAGHWNVTGWIGRDLDRLSFRTTGDVSRAGSTATATDALYARAIHPWWDVAGGVRHDTGDGPSRSWVAFGVRGLAPYWVHLSATAYAGASGRTMVRVEADHELLLTNRLVALVRAEAEVHGRDDPARRTGRGLSATAVGLRLRYEITREFAPYAGIQWRRLYAGTANHARRDESLPHGVDLVVGLRLWR